MSLPIEAEELLDVLRQRILDSELKEIAQLIGAGIAGEDLRYMQILEYRILKVYRLEGWRGYAERQHICEEIARLHG